MIKSFNVSELVEPITLLNSKENSKASYIEINMNVSCLHILKGYQNKNPTKWKRFW